MAHVLQQSNRAAAAVFDITELFEHILLETTIPDLFVHQRVSKKWFDFIKTSKKLQKKMFLLADGEPVAPIWLSSGTERKLGFTRYAAQMLTVNPKLYRGGWNMPRPFPYVGCVNLCDQTRSEVPVVGFWMFNASTTYNAKWAHGLEWARGRDNIGASWRRMLLTQPPITVLDLEQNDTRLWRWDTQLRGPDTRLGQRTDVVKMQNAEGITLGDLFQSTTEGILGVSGDGINNSFACDLNICSGGGVCGRQDGVGNWA